MANTYLQRSISNGNRRTWTWSAWVKRAKLSTTQILADNYTDNNNYAHLYFSSGNTLNFYSPPAGTWSWHPVFRDTSAWYHIVLRCDTTQASNGDRLRLYVNGELQSANAVAGINQDQELNFNASSQLRFGARQVGSSDYFNGLMSHAHFTDGYSYAPTEFGQTDATTGQWSIITSPNVSYGTNGYFILKDGNSVTDQSGEGNDFTVAGGSLTKTQDNPSNFFATLSPDMLPRNSGETIANGNLFFGESGAIWNTESSVFGVTNGKYYFEVKLKDNGTDRRFRWGLQKNEVINTTGENKVLCGTDNPCIGYRTGGESATQGGYLINFTDTALSDGDINENNAIYGFAIDLDNQRMYGHFNGTWLHSGNPSAGSGGIDVSSFYTVGEPLFPSFTVHHSNIELNFGNGYFGTTAVATNSGNGYQDADGNGIFNYTVPTNYRAFCSKGLNQ